MPKLPDISKFKDEVLSELYKYAGESISINHIIEKYTESVFSFKIEDRETPDRIRKMKTILLELKNNLGWITLFPVHGINNMYQFNSVTGEYEFSDIQKIIAKMTTVGEIEYKKTLKDPWYKNWIMVFVVYPVVATILGWIIIELIQHIKADQSKKLPNSTIQQKDTGQKKK